MGLPVFDFLQNPSFSDHFKRRSEDILTYITKQQGTNSGFSQNSGILRILYELAAFENMTLLYRNRNRYDSLRYTGRNYSSPGKYFVTICTTGTKEQLGNVINSKMHLSEIGQIASKWLREIPVHFPFIGLDAFVVMPNHIHGIIIINRSVEKPIVGALHATPLPHHEPLPPHDTAHLTDKTMSFISPKSGSLSVVFRLYRSAVTKQVHRFDSSFFWQRGFYDSIICTTGQTSRFRKYISDNAQNWDLIV